MTAVLDASALPRVPPGRPGSDVVEVAMDGEPVCGAANW